MSYQAEYIWIDGTEPSPLIRSKTRILPDGKKPGIWGFDGSSTNQATGENSDCVLNPVFSCPDPLREPGDILVMCEVLLTDMTPHPTNTRAACAAAAEKYADMEPWFGIEQEYTFMKEGRPLGWPEHGFPAPQGPYYCGVGGDKMPGRDIVERHTKACMDAGLAIEGTNAEVMMGQWEFQIGVLPPPAIGDQLWVARWLLFRIAEDYGAFATLDPKPVSGDWNGAGAHTNFSTKAMREDGGWDAIIAGCEAIGKKVTEHVENYGVGIDRAADRGSRDGPLEQVQLRDIGPGRLHPHPLGGGPGQKGLAGGPPAQRQHGPLRGHAAARQHGLLGRGVGRPTPGGASPGSGRLTTAPCRACGPGWGRVRPGWRTQVPDLRN